MQSGGFQRWVAKPLHQAERNFAAVTKALDCQGAATISCLLNKSAEELLAQSEAVRLPSTDGWDSCQWSPVIDGVELTRHPMELLESGDVAPGVRLVLGIRSKRLRLRLRLRVGLGLGLQFRLPLWLRSNSGAGTFASRRRLSRSPMPAIFDCSA